MIRFLVVSRQGETAQNLAVGLQEESLEFQPGGVGYAVPDQLYSCWPPAVDLFLIDYLLGLAAVRELTRRIREIPGSARAIVFNVNETAVRDVADIIEGGAVAYVPRQAAIDELIRICVRVSQGLPLCCPQVAFEVFERISKLSSRHSTSEWVRSRQLSKREMEILQLLGLDYSNKAIANCLFLSVPTVKNHIHRLLYKLGVRSREEAVAFWRYVGHCKARIDPSCTPSSIDTVDRELVHLS